MAVIVDEKRELLAEHDLMFIAGCPAVYHSHHYNLFFDQTVDDALGPERGVTIRARASHEACYRLLSALLAGEKLEDPAQGLERAVALFAALGQGRLGLEVGERGGSAVAESLHYATAYGQKYGRKVARSYPADAFASGFIAAGAEVVHQLDPGALSCIQTVCPSTGGDRAEFDVRRAFGRFEAKGVGREQASEVLPVAMGGLHEDRIARIAAALRRVLFRLEPDARGLIESFGVLLSCHPADYYNHLSARMLDIALTEKPQALDSARELVREAAQACAFHLFGGIMVSPEWTAAAGPPPAKAIDVIVGGLAAARALGYGRWALEAYVPDESLVLRSPGTYESVYAKLAGGDNDEPCSYQLQGAALALMQLAHRVEWSSSPEVSLHRYLELRKEAPFSCKQTHCLARGDAIDRVVVMRRG